MPEPLAWLGEDYEWTRDAGGESGGAVFRLDQVGAPALFLKHGSGPVAEDVAAEAERLAWLAGRVPATALRQFAREGDNAWLVTTAISGLTGDGWLEWAPERLPMIVRAFAGFLRMLHALPVEDCPFDASYPVRLAHARRNIAAGLVDEDDFDPDHDGWSAAEILAEVERLAPARVERVVTHGDFSLGNLLLDADGRVTGCIDVGRLGVADPYQDIAILWTNLGEYGVEAQRLLLDELGIVEPDERRLAFHRCLDELF